MRAFAPLAILIAGCGDPLSSEVAHTWTLDPTPVDVVFVLDNSSSMAQVQAQVGEAFPNLRAALEAEGIDWQVGVTTTDFDDVAGRGRLVELEPGLIVLDGSRADADAIFEQGAQVGTGGSAFERGLAAGLAAVTPPRTTHDNEGLRRDGARVGVVVVTDEDDCSDDGRLAGRDPDACAQRPGDLVGVEEFVDRFAGVPDDPQHIAVHGLLEPGGEDGCAGASASTRVRGVVAGTGGLALPVCGDFGDHFTRLGLELAGRRTRFPLSFAPDESSVEVALDGPGGVETYGAEAAGQSWRLDPDHLVLEWIASPPPLGTTVTVRYRVPVE